MLVTFGICFKQHLILGIYSNMAHQKCIDYLVSTITVVINLLLSSGNMLSDLKEAMLMPLIKKACLDPEIFNHFRPISNLTYLSKL